MAEKITTARRSVLSLAVFSAFAAAASSAVSPPLFWAPLPVAVAGAVVVAEEPTRKRGIAIATWPASEWPWASSRPLGMSFS